MTPTPRAFIAALLVGVTVITDVQQPVVATSLRARELEALATPPLSCYIEEGYDYVGQDIKNVPGANPGACCWQCYTTTGCKAYSWTDQNGGTCWLKSGRDGVIAKANVKSALLLYGQPKMCELQHDMDYEGYDIGSAWSGSADGCCDLCHKYTGCRAYSWSNHLGGTCWFKSQKGSAIYKAGVKSAEAYPTANPPTNQCTLQQNTDYVGYDIGNAYSPTAGGCCDICKNTNGCRAFAWSNHLGGTCWLKSQKGPVVTNNGVIAAQVHENPPYTCSALEQNVDYINHDVGNAPSANAEDCCSLCKGFSGCKAFTWSDHEGGTCWFKSQKDGTTYKAGVKSATV